MMCFKGGVCFSNETSVIFLLVLVAAFAAGKIIQPEDDTPRSAMLGRAVAVIALVGGIIASLSNLLWVGPPLVAIAVVAVLVTHRFHAR